MNAPLHITSRDNPLLKKLRLMVRDSTAYRKHGQVWLEGDHLCRALLARGKRPAVAIFAESSWPFSLFEIDFLTVKAIVIPDALMKEISSLETPCNMGFVLDWPGTQEIQRHAPTVVLDRVQDAGNVGSIIRSAAAFGFTQVVALKGTAALWSSKVLRAGMGAHFAMHMVEGSSEADLQKLEVPLLVTSSHHGEWLHKAALPWPCAWVMGHEGQGVSTSLMNQAQQQLRIAQPGGEESLNVAAAAAVCFYANSLKPS